MFKWSTRELSSRYRTLEYSNPVVEYTCTKSTHHRVHICCRPDQLCLEPYTTLTDLSPSTCTPGELTDCATGTLCLPRPPFDMTAKPLPANEQTYFCCLDKRIAECSSGLVPIMDDWDRLSRPCEALNPNGCPETHKCERLKDGVYGWVTVGYCIRYTVDVVRIRN